MAFASINDGGKGEVNGTQSKMPGTGIFDPKQSSDHFPDKFEEGTNYALFSIIDFPGLFDPGNCQPI